MRDLLVQSAVGSLEVPYLAPRTSPGGTPALPLITGLDTWLWVDGGSWAPVQATASISIASVTATATPTRLTFRPGDGTEPKTCNGPGRAWTEGQSPAGACTHRYDQTSDGGTWPLQATVTWEVTWTCTPGCGAGDAAPFVLTVTRPVTVQQVQTRISR